VVAVSAKPTTSKGRRGAGAIGRIKTSAATSPAMPIGTLKKKIQRHEANVVTNPPIGGPSTGAIRPGHVINEIALSNSLLLDERSTTVRPTGTIIAPAAPCAMRATMNAGSDVQSPHSAEMIAKRAMAAQKVVRAPMRSAIQPLSGMNAARATR
jgi:hypothetical protein